MIRRALKVLLIDDDEESYLLTRHLLSEVTQWTFEVDWVPTYEEGLEAVRPQAHDIYLVDYRLDGHTGLDLLHEAMEMGCRAPMIMLTGLGDREVDLQAMRAGAADYLPKADLSPELLERSIRYALERRRLHAALEERAQRLRVLAGQLNRAEQRERSRIARLLHDHLQQILVAAKMQVEGLRPRVADEDVDHLREMLDEVLEVSRTLTIELSPPVLLDAGLAAALKWLVRWMNDRHNLRVVADIDKEAEPASDQVRLMLFHALREVLLNVSKHAKVDEARVTMRQNGDDVEIIVADEGVGFDPSILEPNSEVPSEMRLGNLRERVELIGGSMTIDTAPGKGCRVTLRASRLPLPEPSAPPPTPPEPSEPGVRPIRVLLADDHAVVRESLRLAIEGEADLEVIGEAKDGQEAIDLTMQLQPDVVVMDLLMPGVNGVDATRRIMADLPRTCVVGLSMYGDEEMEQIMRRVGAAAYLSKGGPIQTLLETIRNCRQPEAASAAQQEESDKKQE